ncbi:MAG: hypothetical protein K9M03_04245 [Kiritimatiellales bacterium]|nr:hypothetical protein [Kiritimatiellales bacterium]
MNRLSLTIVSALTFLMVGVFVVVNQALQDGATLTADVDCASDPYAPGCGFINPLTWCCYPESTTDNCIQMEGGTSPYTEYATQEACEAATICGGCTDASCDDGNDCNGVETCEGGVCNAGAPPICDDGNACSTDVCNPSLGCVYTPIDCNDYNSCTNDACVGGSCTHVNNGSCTSGEEEEEEQEEEEEDECASEPLDCSFPSGCWYENGGSITDADGCEISFCGNLVCGNVQVVMPDDMTIIIPCGDDSSAETDIDLKFHSEVQHPSATPDSL